MSDIYYIDRASQKKEKEKVYGEFFIRLLYGKGFLSRLFSFTLLPLVARVSFLSHLYGLFQKSRLSRFKVMPFIRAFHVDASEFQDEPASFRSFNDFFIRHLKRSSRPIDMEPEKAVLPADARYLAFQDLGGCPGIWVKGKHFTLSELLQDKALAERYARGSLLIARLCPTDYHRFHFPCDCTPGAAHLINGPLFSVNPAALKRNIEILAENKRMITTLHSSLFGETLMIEVGATYVGSILQTYTPDELCLKGEEKGYFSFGGSCILLLFEPGKILLDSDLTAATEKGLEIRALMGQSLGRKPS